MNTGWIMAGVVAVCMAVSFLLSGMEAGVFALSRLRIRHLKRQGRRSAMTLHEYLEHPEDFLWTILVGNTMTSFTAVACGVIWLHQITDGRLEFFLPSMLALVLGYYAICDLAPKVLFRAYPNRLCLLLATPFKAVHNLLRPAVRCVAWIARGLQRWTGGGRFTGLLFGNREEFKELIRETGQGLTKEEHGMISRVLDLQSRSVGDLMIPLSSATTARTDTPIAEVFQVCKELQLTRLPVWRGSGDSQRIAGILSIEPLLYTAGLDRSRAAGEFIKPALYLDEGMRLEEALRRMQRSGERLAIVMGDGGHEVGLVSLQDIFRYVFGEVTS